MHNVFRHPTLYFDDGNIVLSAVSNTHNELLRAINNTPDGSDTSAPQTLLFRVHRSILMENSDIFRDMLELPESPSGVNEKYDGVPVVQMPDSAKEIEDILKVFYRPWENQLQRCHPDTCLQVKNTLAMAVKYQFTKIKQLIVAHIEADWPKTLEEWDWFEDYAKSLLPFRRPEYTTPEPAAAAVLAWRFGIHRVLPAVFYDLNRIKISDDWDNISVNDLKKTTFTFGCAPSASNWKPDAVGITRLARWRLLDGDHLRSMLRGREKIELFIEEKATLLGNGGEFCKSEDCRKRRKVITESVLVAGRSRDPLSALRHQPNIPLLVSVCSECKHVLEERVGGLRADIWKKLPEFFDLRDGDLTTVSSSPDATS
ncbi:hypothetical protein M0805_001857 [Coniferiporia weirii]|nr:hypothetical protein M0805_001857 [Coniferiporia weirii]